MYSLGGGGADRFSMCDKVACMLTPTVDVSILDILGLDFRESAIFKQEKDLS